MTTITTLTPEIPISFTIVNLTVDRGYFGEIIACSGTPDLMPMEVINRFASALPEKFQIFDSKGRGDALSFDLYGYDREQDIAVIQIRHSFRRYKNGYLTIHKDYVLVGRNEISGQFFRHPVSAAAVRAGIRKNPDDFAAAVLAAQCWMWGVTKKQLTASLEGGMRQGDILLVKERMPQADAIALDRGITTIIANSHEVRAQRIVELTGGRILAEGPSLWHIKLQHAPTFADDEGWYSIRVAGHAATWQWGGRLGD